MDTWIWLDKNELRACERERECEKKTEMMKDKYGEPQRVNINESCNKKKSRRGVLTRHSVNKKSNHIVITTNIDNNRTPGGSGLNK